MGVVDFVHRPFDNKLVKKRVKNAVTLFQYQAELEEKAKTDRIEQKLKKRTTTQKCDGPFKFSS